MPATTRRGDELWGALIASPVRRLLRHTLATRSRPVTNISFRLVEQAAWDALATGSPSCTRQTFGDCTVSTCPPAEEPDPNIDPSTLPSLARHQAGTVSVTADTGEYMTTLSPTGTNDSYEYTVGGSIVGGEVLTISASGGTIPAFQGELPVPLAPLLTSHVGTVVGAGPESAVSVPRGVDFHFTWDPRGATQTLLAQVASASSASTSTVGCRFDAALGSGTIPAAALAVVQSGDEIHVFSTHTVAVSTALGTVDLMGAIEIASEDRMTFPYFVVE